MKNITYLTTYEDANISSEEVKRVHKEDLNKEATLNVPLNKIRIKLNREINHQIDLISKKHGIMITPTVDRKFKVRVKLIIVHSKLKL